MQLAPDIMSTLKPAKADKMSGQKAKKRTRCPGGADLGVHHKQVLNNKTLKKEKKAPAPKIAFRENVHLTQDEHDKLIQRYDSMPAQKMIEKLSNHKAANGKKYKSDYRAIRNWVVEWWQEKGSKLATAKVESQPGKYDGIAQKEVAV